MIAHRSGSSSPVSSQAPQVALAVVVWCSSSLLWADSAFKAVEEREREYKEVAESAKADLIKAFTREILKANSDGRSDDVARLTEHLKYFRTNGIMMTAELYEDFIAYGSRLHDARRRLLRAYKDAEIECVEQLRLEEAEEMRALARAIDSRLVSIRLARRHTDFVQHGDYLASAVPVRERPMRLNATFELVPGLSDPDAVSFRSINVPNHYLTHGDLRLRLQEFEDSDGYRQNATFRMRRGQGNKSALMFVSVNFPTHCIHARARGELWVDKIEPTGRFSDRAEFEIVEPQMPFWGEPETPGGAGGDRK